VVNVELADVDWDEATLFAGRFSMYLVWVLQLVNVTFVDCLAPVPAGERLVLISEFNLGVTTD
jgi:hypothetical protein